MKANPLHHGIAAAALLSLMLLAAPLTAKAVPSYARQTGVSCAACHLSYPELTSFGRMFKLNGYVQSTEEKIGEGSENLSINSNFPLSAMINISYSKLSKPELDSTNDPNLRKVRNPSDVVLFPEEFSIFYAGRISPNIGAFIQVTYDGGEDKLSVDNTDIRFVNSANLGGSILTYGLTLNNNPTVQDLWNSTPGWGFPFASSPVTPSPSGSIQLDGGLGQQVAGLGAYAGLLKDTWLYYAELTAYKTALLGVAPNTSSQSNVIRGFAPYWRLAAEKNFGVSNWEFGVLGMNATYVPYGDVAAATDPGGTAPQTIGKLPTNKFADFGADTQFQYVSSDTQLSVKALWLHEDNKWSSLSAANHSKTTSSLDTDRVTFSYYKGRLYGFNVQEFVTTGGKDVFYETRTGSPDTSGQMLELVYTPWLNTRFSLAFTNFEKFNGSVKNYDGNGRNAADNNTTYLLAWLMF
jgi:hypothetical protein